MTADVYAFACLAYETLTGRVLFDADNEIAQIALHLAHDGLPAPLEELGRRPAMGALVDLLHSALRRDPRGRPSVSTLRTRLESMTADVARHPWPLPA